MRQSDGVPQSHHYQAIARCLGHTSLTRVTMQSYIGPLGNLLSDNSAVLFGEEEGDIGGRADVEARVARLPEYKKFVVKEGVGNVVRRKDDGPKKSSKLPPEISRMVDADPVVAAAKRVMVDSTANWRRALSREFHSLNPTTGMSYEEEIRDCQSAMQAATKTHTRVRCKVVRAVVKNSNTSRKMKKVGAILALKLCPDIFSKTLHLLREYHEERESAG